ncbi:MAG: hypothetical protein WCK65_02240 [Rhodospirillaceae bacterium]
MRRGLLVIALMTVMAAPLRAEPQSVPVHSTFQTPPPESAETPPGKSILGVRLPTMPKMPALPTMPKMPVLPSLPDMLSTVGALPERIGLPNASRIIDNQFDKLVAKLNIAIPAVETLGYEVRNFEVDWTLPPMIKVRLQSSESVSDAEYEHVLRSVKGDYILESIILSLNGVHKIQTASGLAPFKRAVLEVDIGVPPHVIMTFSDPSNKYQDRFAAHRAELKKAMAEGKPFPAKPAPPPLPLTTATKDPATAIKDASPPTTIE